MLKNTYCNPKKTHTRWYKWNRYASGRWAAAAAHTLRSRRALRCRRAKLHGRLTDRRRDCARRQWAAEAVEAHGARCTRRSRRAVAYSLNYNFSDLPVEKKKILSTIFEIML